MNRALAEELAAMAAEDQRIRRAPSDGRFAHRLPLEVAMEHARIDVANADRLGEIIAEHGWPGRSLVGDDGAQHAWLIAQHADRQLDFQREALALLTEAVERGEAPPDQLAYLADRVRVNEGREQVYGTQIGAVVDGAAVPWPIEDPDRLDERRAAAGLEPWAEYAGGWAGPE